jgi:hypothetical protein
MTPAHVEKLETKLRGLLRLAQNEQAIAFPQTSTSILRAKIKPEDGSVDGQKNFKQVDEILSVSGVAAEHVAIPHTRK